MSFTLMLTCGGGELMPQLVRMLKASRRHDLKIISVDSGEPGIIAKIADEFRRVPRGDEPGYAETIAALVSELGVDMVLPGSDEEALALAKNRSLIEDQGCRLACASFAALELFSNKAKCYERFAAAGLPVPVWKQASDVDALRACIAEVVELTGSAVVKPAVSRGGRDVFVLRRDLNDVQQIAGGRELHLPLSRMEDLVVPAIADKMPAVVMQLLKEPVYDLDMLAWKGKPIHVVPRRRVSSAAPNAGHTFVDDSQLIDLGKRLIAEFELSWLYDCDLMYDAEGRPQILEVNPRPSGSATVTMAAGVPLFEDLVSLAKGEAVPPVPLPVGRVVMPYKALYVV